MLGLFFLLLGSGFDAVALRPDGKQLAVGGSNRVVYLLDSETLAVQRRLGTTTRVRGLAFSPDGQSVLVVDERDTLRQLEGTTGKTLATLEDARQLVISPDGTLGLVRGQTLRLIRLADLRVLRQLETGEPAVAYAFDASGKRIVVLEQSQFSEDERRVPADEVPSKLTGLAREEFRYRHDGRISILRTLDSEGKETGRRRLWYSSDSDSTLLVIEGDTLRILNRSQTVAHLNALGEITLRRWPLPVIHARAATADGKRVALGSRSGGRIEGEKAVAFRWEELPGQAEFVTGLRFAPNGVLFGVTSAFRVFRVDVHGKVERIAAVY
jgi:dipeptidyl aminopeptidase/acylaminoacyl peptidase